MSSNYRSSALGTLSEQWWDISSRIMRLWSLSNLGNSLDMLLVCLSIAYLCVLYPVCWIGQEETIRPSGYELAKSSKEISFGLYFLPSLRWVNR